MSCFVLSSDHINALLEYAHAHQIPLPCTTCSTEHKTLIADSELTEFGRIMLAENIRSVEHEYAHNPAMLGYAGVVEAHRFKAHGKVITHRQALNAAKCYEYQSCECVDWPSTHARRIYEAIHDHALLIHGELSSVDRGALAYALCYAEAGRIEFDPAMTPAQPGVVTFSPPDYQHYGRNGHFAAHGVHAHHVSDTLWLEGISSRGRSESARLVIPMHKLDDLIAMLTAFKTA